MKSKTKCKGPDPGPGNVTLVLPSYNELENVDTLLSEISRADHDGYIKRVIYVDDDSPDGTSEYIKHKIFDLDVLCLHRIGRQGLSSAVVEGILLADTDYVAVMDADGQHAPSDLIKLIAALNDDDASIAIGSRFKNKTTHASLSSRRTRISNLGNLMCRLLLKKTLTDPLTGFFVMDRHLFVEAARSIRPSGFKILLDILHALRNKDVVVVETQIDFRARYAGESKLDSGVVLEFAEQVLNQLTKGLIPKNFLGFSIVGGSGVFVHLASLYALLFLFQTTFVISQSIATVLAIIWNYTLNNRLTFRRNRKHGFRWLKGLIVFMAICSIGAIANVGIASMFNSNAVTWWISGLTGIVVGIIFNFTLSKFLVWKP